MGIDQKTANILADGLMKLVEIAMANGVSLETAKRALELCDLKVKRLAKKAEEEKA